MAEGSLARFVAATTVLFILAAILAAPLLSAAHPAGIAIYSAFSWVCHQRPERSWHLAGRPVAVCVRCCGIYAGALAAACLKLRFSRRVFVFAMTVTAFEWAGEVLGWPAVHSLQTTLRFAVGFLAGCSILPAVWTEQTRSKGRISAIEAAA